MTAYRTSPAKVADAEPKTLSCWLADGDKYRWLRTLWIRGVFTSVVSMMVFTTNARLSALCVLIAGCVWSLRALRGRRGAEVTFVVERETVRVRRGRQSEIVLTFEQLHDVRLDTKSSNRLHTVARADGVNTVFGMTSNHRVEVDVSRIELLFDDDESVLLAPDFINGSLAQESLRSIKLFLRKQGWKPADEREQVEPA